MTKFSKTAFSVILSAVLVILSPGLGAWNVWARTVATSPTGFSGVQTAPIGSLTGPRSAPGLETVGPLDLKSSLPVLAPISLPETAPQRAVSSVRAAPVLIEGTRVPTTGVGRDLAPKKAERPVAASLKVLKEKAAKKNGERSLSLSKHYDGSTAGAGAASAVAGRLSAVSPSALGLNSADAAAQAKEMLAGDKKAELVMPGFYWGGLDLDKLSAASVDLEPRARLRLDAYKNIVAYGLRAKGYGRANAVGTPSAAAKVLAYDAGKEAGEVWLDAIASVKKELGLSETALSNAVMDSKKIDDSNDIPQEVLKRAIDLGLHRMKFPVEHGGLGLNQREYVEILEVISRFSPSLAGQLSAQNTIGTAPLTMFGTAEQQNKYLPALTRGDGLVAFGLTEPTAGTDIDKMETTAVLSEDGKTWRLTGKKVFITGIMDAQMVYLVAGHTIVDGVDVGPTVFIVDDLGFKVDEDWDAKKRNLLSLEGRGMRITPWTRDGFEFMMIKGTDQGYIQLSDFELPDENVLGPVGKDPETRLDGKKVPLRSLNKGRAGFAYISDGARWFADRQLEWAADRIMFDMYAPEKGMKGRQGFMEFPAKLIGRSRIKAAVLRVLSKYSSALIDANPDSSVAALSALIKVRVSDWNWENALDALELGGGHALIKDAPGRVYQNVLDSWIARIVEGVNPAMSQFPHMMAGGKVMKAMGTVGGIARVAILQTVNLLVPFVPSNRGALPRGQAKWIQRRTAEFAVRFAGSSVLLGVPGFVRYTWKSGKWWRLFNPVAWFKGVMISAQIEFAPHQTTLINAFEAQADILSLAMVQLELKRNKELDVQERKALQAAVGILQRRIKTNLRKVTPWGDVDEKAQAEVGRALIDAALEIKGSDRPNRVAEHLEFLQETADRFYDRLHGENGSDAAAAAARFSIPIPGEADAASQARLKTERHLRNLRKDIQGRVEVAPGARAGAPRIAVVAAKRLPQGKFPNSAMKRESAKSLGTGLVGSLLESAGLAVSDVDALIRGGNRVKFFYGSVDSSEAPDLGREIAVELGLRAVPGTGIAKNCGTSLESAALGMSALLSGDADIIVAGGAEVMSRFPQFTKDPVLQKQVLTLLVLPGMIKNAGFVKAQIMRFVYAKTWLQHKWRKAFTQNRYAIAEGLSIADVQMIDTAETLARKYGAPREAQDWYAYASQTRAAEATRKGLFDDEIAAYGEMTVDQGIRFGQSRSGFKKLKPVMGDSVTAGNASQISDGASGVLLMTEEKAAELGLEPLAYIKSVVDTGLDPEEMGLGPAYSLPLAAKRAGVALDEIPVFEINEAFAAQTLAVMTALGLPGGKVNTRGGAIALGHPLAASGARILTTLIHAMRHDGHHLGACSLCVGGGEGIAAVVERDPSGVSDARRDALLAGLGSRGVSNGVIALVRRTINGLAPLERSADSRGLMTALEENLEIGSSTADPGRYRSVVEAVQSDRAVFEAELDSFKRLRVSLNEHGVATVAMDHAPVNAIDESMVRALEAFVDRAEVDDRIKAVVLTGKGRAFAAGADLKTVSEAQSPEQAAQMADELQKVIDRLEALEKPVVAALGGDTLGGGSEIAMGSHERIAGGEARLSQPEVKLLFNPGAGGTQRLVRLVGLTKGLTAMNSGETKDAHSAHRMGWVDRVVSPADLIREAQGRARALAELSDADRAKWVAGHRTLSRPVKLTWLERIGMLFNGFMIKRTVVAQTKSLAKKKAKEALDGKKVSTAEFEKKVAAEWAKLELAVPAMMGIIDATLTGVKRGPKTGLKRESEIFGRLAASPASKLVQKLFLRATGGPKLEGMSDGSVEPLPIHSVGVVGAGVMGAGIAQLAAFNGQKVVLKDINQDALDKGVDKIRGLFEGLHDKLKFSREQVEKKMALIEGIVDEPAFAAAAPSLVIEAVAENMNLKKKLFSQWDRELPPETILATNTSALSVTEIALATSRPGKVVGLHFFNPPHKLPLVELILPDRSKLDAAQREELKRTVATVVVQMKKMGRVVVVSEDRPGFVVNRILTTYINEALELLEDGAAIEAIDGAMKKLGLPMGPLELADFVGAPLGVEVGAYLERTLEHFGELSIVLPVINHWKETFYDEGGNPKTDVVAKAVKVAKGLNMRGVRSTDADFGAWVERLTQNPDLDVAVEAERQGPRWTREEIEKRLIDAAYGEGKLIVKEGTVSGNAEIDIAMTVGMGFPIQTGGLMRYAEARP